MGQKQLQVVIIHLMLFTKYHAFDSNASLDQRRGNSANLRLKI
jgi:hypothetical protein